MRNTVIEEKLKKGESCVLTVEGTSMLPFLRPKEDQVVIVPFSGVVKKYNVLLYVRENGQYVLHRVVKKKRDELWMRGDHQYTVERNILPSSCIGRLEGTWKNAGSKKERYVRENDVVHRVEVALWFFSFFPRKLAWHTWRALYRLISRKKRHS